MQRFATLIAFLAVVVGGGTLIGFATGPGPWYDDLAKPWFNPPGWVFGPVWTLLYVMIAIAGWRIFGHRDIGPAAVLWLVQLILNFAWSPVFFGLQHPGLALAVIAALLAAILAFIAAAWDRDRTAAWLFVPYAAWVSFATMLNAAIVWLN